MGDHRRFFVTPEQIGEDAAVITGDLAHQIARVMRLREGDRLCLLDGLGNEYDARVAALSKGEVTARILGKGACACEPALRLTLAVCLPKGDKLDLIVQKTCELGISRMVVIRSERCVARPDDAKIAARIERWRKVAQEAAEQSGRGCVPLVSWVESFDGLAPVIREHDLSLVAWEDESRAPISEVLRENGGAESVMLIVGPEGGLSEGEVGAAVAAGARCVSLGRRILRCETAAIAGCAAIMYELEGEL